VPGLRSGVRACATPGNVSLGSSLSLRWRPGRSRHGGRLLQPTIGRLPNVAVHSVLNELTTIIRGSAGAPRVPAWPATARAVGTARLATAAAGLADAGIRACDLVRGKVPRLRTATRTQGRHATPDA